MGRSLRLASTQISLAPLSSPEVFWQRVETLVVKSKQQGARVLLLPEYITLSLIVHGHEASIPFRERLDAYANSTYKEFERKILELAKRYAIHIVGGTYPVRLADAHVVNRCLIAKADGTSLIQDKLNMTRFEAEEWHIQSPQEPLLTIFELDGVRCAVAICYDVEFPRVTAMAAGAGVELLLVPSCTDHYHGYWRVRHCAHARTVENQCFVALASVVEGDARFPEMDVHYGQAAILTPCDGSFPERGILAEGQLNQEGLCVATLDLEELGRIRRDGSVLNLRDQNWFP